MFAFETAPDGGGYPVSEVAARHGAGVEEATTDPKVAYARDEPYIDARLDVPWIFDARKSVQ